MPHTESAYALFLALKYAHGIFNGVVILLFVYQGWLGLKIRQSRTSGSPPERTIVRKHRKFGPALAVAGLFGFFGGISAVYLTEGEIFEHPIHFLTGLAVSVLIIVTFAVSRKIRAGESRWRTLHVFIGFMILVLYFFQAYLGIQMLF